MRRKVPALFPITRSFSNDFRTSVSVPSRGPIVISPLNSRTGLVLILSHKAWHSSGKHPDFDNSPEVFTSISAFILFPAPMLSILSTSRILSIDWIQSTRGNTFARLIGLKMADHVHGKIPRDNGLFRSISCTRFSPISLIPKVNHRLRNLNGMGFGYNDEPDVLRFSIAPLACFFNALFKYIIIALQISKIHLSP